VIKSILALLAAAFLVTACEDAPPPPPVAAAPQVRTFLIFFDFDRAVLTPRARDIVKEAANVSKAGQNTRLTVTGHTDTAGPANYNMALSLRRANAVKDQLVREGVPTGQIAVVGKGEDELLVKTRDGVREPQNRRVEIVIR